MERMTKLFELAARVHRLGIIITRIGLVAVLGTACEVPPIDPPPGAGPSIGGCQVLPADNPWNQKATGLAVRSDSSTLLTSIIIDRTSRLPHRRFRLRGIGSGSGWSGAVRVHPAVSRGRADLGRIVRRGRTACRRHGVRPRGMEMARSRCGAGATPRLSRALTMLSARCRNASTIKSTSSSLRVIIQ